MKHFKYSVACLMVLTLVMVFISCAKPPEAEQKAAKDAMDAAVSAGADKYAAADLDAAKKSFDTAEAQVKDKKYKEAKEGYVAAKAAFEKAAGAVAAGKKAVADEATAAIACDVSASVKVQSMLKDMGCSWIDTSKQVKFIWGSDWDNADQQTRLALIKAFANSDACLTGKARNIRFYRKDVLVGEASSTGIRLK